MTKMSAAVLHGPGDLRVEPVDVPAVAPGEVLIQVSICGICMTDFHMYKWSFPVKTPVILGHELSGRVVDIGSNVTGFSVGDKVAVNPLLTCGACASCRSGRQNLCEHARALGGAGEVIVNGGFARFTNVPFTSVSRIPEDMSFEEGAFVEPVATCSHGVEMSHVRLGDAVVLIGAGAIGLIILQLLRMKGASCIIVSDFIEERRKMAEQLGADLTIDPSVQDDVQVVKESTNGRGADVVIEAVGASSSVLQALKMVKKGGRVNIFGVAPTAAKIEVSPFDVYFREIEIVGTYALTAEDFRRSISLVHSRRIKTQPIITDRFPLERIREAFLQIEKKKGLKKHVLIA